MTTEDLDVVVIGAGQAGLATSHELSDAGVEHVVLERQERIGGLWSQLWDSFCLVTPNHTVRLPGGGYAGTDPHGYLPRDDVVRHLRRYAGSFAAPVRTGVDITALAPDADGGLTLRTRDDGRIRARHVVVATGAYQAPVRPPWATALPPGVTVLDAMGYRRPDALPEGPVLVVGSGQTGCQIAEELARSGRGVTLACGRAPWIPRRISGRDCFDWLLETPFFDQALADLPGPAARLLANPQVSGAAGGHDLNVRTLAALGVRLGGRVLGVADGRALLAGDLGECVAWGDARYADLCRLIATACTGRGISAPAMPEPEPFDATGAPAAVDLSSLAAVVITTGFRPTYRSWIDLPEGFDAAGFPVTHDGTSASHPGLHFVGVHFLRTRRSGLLMGVGQDAAIVAGTIATAA